MRRHWTVTTAMLAVVCTLGVGFGFPSPADAARRRSRSRSRIIDLTPGSASYELSINGTYSVTDGPGTESATVAVPTLRFQLMKVPGQSSAVPFSPTPGTARVTGNITGGLCSTTSGSLVMSVVAAPITPTTPPVPADPTATPPAIADLTELVHRVPADKVGFSVILVPTPAPPPLNVVGIRAPCVTAVTKEIAFTGAGGIMALALATGTSPFLQFPATGNNTLRSTGGRDGVTYDFNFTLRRL